MRTFVVWEPVIFTDAFRPRDATLARKLADPRATHYWDPKKSLSKNILDSPWTRKYAVRGGPMGTVWDWVAIYPPGARWERDFPEPIEQAFPVVDASDRIGGWIDRAASVKPATAVPRAEYASLEAARDSIGAILARSLRRFAAGPITRKTTRFEHIYAKATAPGWTFHVAVTDTNCPTPDVHKGLTEAGWVEHHGYSSDGADGTSMGFLSRNYFCLVQGAWEGYDPTEPSHVPRPGCAIDVTCVPRREDDFPPP